MPRRDVLCLIYVLVVRTERDEFATDRVEFMIYCLLSLQCFNINNALIYQGSLMCVSLNNNTRCVASTEYIWIEHLLIVYC
jgi:hypothetical protein